MVLFLRTALAAVVTVCFCASAFAQAQGLRLNRSITGPPAGDQPLPAFVTADKLEGVTDATVEAIGNAELHKGNTTLSGDRIKYFVPDDEAEATGDVRLLLLGDEITGPRLRLRVGDTTGIFDSPTFRFAPRVQSGTGKPTATRGTADALRFDGEKLYRIAGGSFTSCKPGQDDWFVHAAELDLDYQRQEGTARRASLEFLGWETPRLPWFDFSLNNERKTGFLPPTFAVQGKHGPEIATPFYWNIAPNYDATITPRYMERRGLQALNQFRYLQPEYFGEARVEYLPHDKILNDRRWAYNWLHRYVSGSWSTLININRVSDNNYFRDLSGRLAVATQVYLPREGSVSYASPSGLWNATGRIQKFQTLQDPAAPVGLPYNRVPQLGFNYLRQVVGGFDAAVASEFVAFQTEQPSVPVGRRLIAYPSLSWPFLRAGGYVTPKIGLHSTLYSLTNQAPGVERTPQRTLPIASVDGGLYFDRDMTYFGRELQQTLEPRVYYLYVPFRDQSKLPLFDTSVADFNFAQIFSENYYSGPDRISDANQLTVAATSRLINPGTGQEVLRGIFGQRYYFSEQRVALTPDTPLRTKTNSPFLLGLAGQVAEHWTAEATVQYAVGGSKSPGGVERANFGVRYSPEVAKVLNLGYRFTGAGITTTAQQIRQIDVSAQWPLGRGWYVLGRYNYDLAGRQANEVLAGVEYNAGCWIVRAVVQSFITATHQRTSLFFLQLELDGFSRLGSNPIEALRRNIPGYSLLGAPSARIDASPFGGGPLESSTALPYGGTGRVPYDVYN